MVRVAKNRGPGENWALTVSVCKIVNFIHKPTTKAPMGVYLKVSLPITGIRSLCKERMLQHMYNSISLLPFVKLFLNLLCTKSRLLKERSTAEEVAGKERSMQATFLSKGVL
jgi:hypothetical protein